MSGAGATGLLIWNGKRGYDAALDGGDKMPKYMIQASYTAEGLKGLQKEGGSGRMNAIKALFKAAGGKLEATYWALGDYDAIVIGDLPDTVTASALATAVCASGLVRTKTTV